jgi:hypothetical protein
LYAARTWVAVKSCCSWLLNNVAPELPPQALKPAPPKKVAAETAPVVLKKLRREVAVMHGLLALVVTPSMALLHAKKTDEATTSSA